MNLGLEMGSAAPALVAALRARAEAARLWAERTLPKGAIAFAPGEDRTGDVHLLLRGLIRLVYTTGDGEAWIKSFIIDRGVFSGRGAADSDDSYSAEAVEPCRLVRLPRTFVEDLVARDDTVRIAYAAFQTWILARKQAREAALLTLTPEARLRAILTQAAPVAARLPQGDIARFIGVTPVAFSRIKLRIAQAGSMSPSARRA
ncbi:MAG: Crp/Fnr family transcriptional regulator [Tabrizicola sp.]